MQTNKYLLYTLFAMVSHLTTSLLASDDFVYQEDFKYQKKIYQKHDSAVRSTVSIHKNGAVDVKIDYLRDTDTEHPKKIDSFYITYEFKAPKGYGLFSFHTPKILTYTEVPQYSVLGFPVRYEKKHSNWSTETISFQENSFKTEQVNTINISLYWEEEEIPAKGNDQINVSLYIAGIGIVIVVGGTAVYFIQSKKNSQESPKPKK